MKLVKISLAVALAIMLDTVHGIVDCNYPNRVSTTVYKGMNFSITDLSVGNTEGWYMQDKTNADTDAFKFYFNICGTSKAPTECGSKTSDPGDAAAWRIVKQNGQTTCNAVGIFDPLQRPAVHKVDVYDTNRPAAGVRLTYSPGERLAQCNANQEASTSTQWSSAFSVALLCGDKPMPDSKTLVQGHVDAIGQCHYQSSFMTRSGCPTQCGHGNKICGGQGHCAYDVTAQTARCFCNEGYSGKNCSPIHKSTSSAGAIGALFGGIVMGILGVGVFYWYKHRRSTEYTEQLDDQEGFY